MTTFLSLLNKLETNLNKSIKRRRPPIPLQKRRRSQTRPNSPAATDDELLMSFAKQVVEHFISDQNYQTELLDFTHPDCFEYDPLLYLLKEARAWDGKTLPPPFKIQLEHD